MEHRFVLTTDALDSSDPHGYYGGCGRREVNVRSPSKRSFLKECIRQIYIIKGKAHLLPAVPSPIEFNRDDIWQKLNTLLQPHHSDWRSTFLRVKRQLFREPKHRARKSRAPLKRKHALPLQAQLYFKPLRSRIGTRRVRRNYLEEARSIAAYRASVGKDEGVATGLLNITTADGDFQISTHTISNVCKYHKNMVRADPPKERMMAARNRNTMACRLGRRARVLEDLLLEEQYQQNLRIREQVLQVSLRSVYYMKALFGLLVDRERNLRV